MLPNSLFTARAVSDVELEMRVRGVMKFLAATTVILSVSTGAASAVTVKNGSFEDVGTDAPKVDRGSWDVYHSIPGWQTISGTGIEVQTNTTLGSIDAHNGSRYVELDSHPGNGSNSTMQQLISLVAGTYTLSFFYSPRTQDAGTNGIRYSIGSISDTVTGPGAGIERGSWTEIVANFSVDRDGDYPLQFAAIGAADTYGGLIDNVSIAPIPVPAGAVLLLTALGGLTLMGRRQSG